MSANATTLRAVMSKEQFMAGYEEMIAQEGDPDANDESLRANRDRKFAAYFNGSGCTQQQIAEYTGKSQPWVAYRLRLGRFLGYATGTMGAITITEGRFRGLWEATNNSATETERFDAVIRMMQKPKPAPEPQPAPLDGPKPKKQVPSPKVDKAREIVRPLVESGQVADPVKLAKEHGLSPWAVSAARDRERGRLEGLQEAAGAEEAIDVSILLSRPMQEKYAALERRLLAKHEADYRRLVAKYEAEYDERVSHGITKHINEYLMPHYKERLEKADMLSKIGRPFTTVEYLSLLRALHADSTSPENRQGAFVLLKKKEVLLRPEERERPFSSNLPETVGELMAMRKVKRT